MMKVNDFIEKLQLALNSKTFYVYGCFGAPMTDKNKVRYMNNNSYNKAQAKDIESLDADTFGFDCVNLIKGILWGWNKDNTRVYGGAGYCVDGVPDVGANTMCQRYLQNKSSDFSNIQIGEAVWMDGHIGVYIGDGKVIECTPRWDNCVQLTYLKNLSYNEGKCRKWTLHGKLPWIDYSNTVVEKPKPVDNSMVGKRDYKVQKGDTLSKIASKYNTTIEKILEDNLPTHHRMTRNFIVVGWNLKV